MRDINSKIDLDTWVYSPGRIPVTLDFSTPEIEESKDLAREYLKLAGEASPANYEVFHDYFSSLKCIFLQELLDNLDQVNMKLIERLDSDFRLTTFRDPEVKTLWYQIAILKEYKTAWPYANEFMITKGRMKYLLPLYKAWNKVDHKVALQIYEAGSSLYHAMARSRIKKILGL